jgi:hypothetical protein
MRAVGAPEVEQAEALADVVVSVLRRARAPTGLPLEIQQRRGRQPEMRRTARQPGTLQTGLRPEILPPRVLQLETPPPPGLRLVRAAPDLLPARLRRVARVPEEAHSAESGAAVVRHQPRAVAVAPVVAQAASVVAAVGDEAAVVAAGAGDELKTD